MRGVTKLLPYLPTTGCPLQIPHITFFFNNYSVYYKSVKSEKEPYAITTYAIKLVTVRIKPTLLLIINYIK